MRMRVPMLVFVLVTFGGCDRGELIGGRSASGTPASAVRPSSV
jgi:hypothetical protein